MLTDDKQEGLHQVARQLSRHARAVPCAEEWQRQLAQGATVHIWGRAVPIAALLLPVLLFCHAGADVWTPVNTGLTDTSVLALAIDPSNPQVIYAGTHSGVFRSTDGGGRWTHTGLTDVEVLGVAPSNPRVLYAGACDSGQYYVWTWGRGVFRSTDAGGTWAPANAGLTDTCVRSLDIAPSDPRVIYAGTGDGGVYGSTDSGGTWMAPLEPNWRMSGTAVVALAVDPSDPKVVYAGTLGSVVKPALAPCGYGGGVYKSTDGGGTWTAASAGLPGTSVWALAIDPSSPLVVYAGTEPGYFADTVGGVFKSTDGGGSWVAANAGLANAMVDALAIASSDPQAIHAGTYAWYGGEDGGVFRSTDGGRSWVNAGMTESYVQVLEVAPSDPQVVYAGTDGGGVLRATFEAVGPTAVRASEHLQVPAQPTLESVYPNPTNAATTVRYSLSAPGVVLLSVCGLTGQRVRLLAACAQKPGWHEVTWDGLTDDGRAAASGVYLVQLETPGGNGVRKVSVVR